MANSVENNWQERLSAAQRNVSKSMRRRMVVIGQAAKDVVESSRGYKTSLDITEDPLYQRVVAADPSESFPVKNSLGRSAQGDVVGEKQALVADVKESSRLAGWDRYLTSINGSAYDNVERKASLLEAGIADLDRTIKGRRAAEVDSSKLEREREDLQRGLAELRSVRPEELRDESLIRPFDKLTPELVQAAKTRISEVRGRAMYAPRKDGFLGFDNEVKARKELAVQRAQREEVQQRLARLMGEQPASISVNQLLGPDGKPLINRFRNELISTLEARAGQTEAVPTPVVSEPVVEPVVVEAGPTVDLPKGPEVDAEDETAVEEEEDARVLSDVGRNYQAQLEEAAAAGNFRLMRGVQERFTEAANRGEISDEQWTALNAEANRLAAEVRARGVTAVPATPSDPTRITLTPAPGSRSAEVDQAVRVLRAGENRGRNRWSLRNIPGTLWNLIRQSRRGVVTTAVIVAGTWFLSRV